VTRAALESPWEEWRTSALRLRHLYTSLDDYPKAVEKALADPSPTVRRAAFELLLKASDVRVAPILARLLHDPERESSKLSILRALERLAVPESIEALVRLIDDKNSLHRSVALSALEKVRKALQQKEEWEKTLLRLRDPSGEQRAAENSGDCSTSREP
jgi:hypothetical protein